jgi:GNAT superfamily N-acetyltransferase
MTEVAIREATRDDVPLLHELIVALAVYEREPNAVTGTPEMLGDALFGAVSVGEALIAEVGGAVAGFALHHGTFSTWECTAGIWLEDLFVHEAYRRAGVGQALLMHLARLTVERGGTRLEWAALAWNTPALDFYAKLGAERLEDWRMHRLDGSALRGLADGGSADR